MDIFVKFEPTTHTMMLMLIIHFFMKFVFTATIKKELREQSHLEVKITPLLQENNNYYSTLMRFKYWGITPSLNVIGFIVMIFEYIFLMQLIWVLVVLYQK